MHSIRNNTKTKKNNDCNNNNNDEDFVDDDEVELMLKMGVNKKVHFILCIL